MPTLHLTHSVSAAGTLQQTGRRSAIGAPQVSSVPWLEPPGVGLERWRDAWHASASTPQWCLHQLGRLLDALASPEHDRLELWVGPSLDEQLWLVAITRLLEDAPARETWLHSIDRDPTGRRALALGALDRSDLIAVGHRPRRFEAADRAQLLRAWRALIAPTPAELVTLLGEDSALLRPLRALAFRFPDPRTGLSACELDLLRSVTQTDQGARVVGYTMGNMRELPELDRDPRDDVELLERLLALSDAESAHPLVRVTNPDGELRDMRVTLTDLGRDVLEGRRCYLDVGDYRARICGFELDASLPGLWCNDGGRLVLRSDPGAYGPLPVAGLPSFASGGTRPRITPGGG